MGQDGQGPKRDMETLSNPDEIEATKRNLEALVEAGRQAEKLLVGNGISEEDAHENDDISDEEGNDFGNEARNVAWPDGSAAESILMNPGSEGPMEYEETQLDSGFTATTDRLLPQQIKDGAELKNNQVEPSNSEDDAMEDLSAVTSHLRSLFKGSVSTGFNMPSIDSIAADVSSQMGQQQRQQRSDQAEHFSGLGEDEAAQPSMTDEEAYEKARQALKLNLRYQRELVRQLKATEEALSHNSKLQASIGELFSMQARAMSKRNTGRGGARGGSVNGKGRGNTRGSRDDGMDVVDHITGDPKVAPNMYFADADNQPPPNNRDTIKRLKNPPIIYRARRWTDQERESLAAGVRQENKKILAQRLYAQSNDPRSIWEVEKMSDRELEMNLKDLDWKRISKFYVPSHKPIECAIQWATHDHPIINKQPWTKKEENKLKEIAQRRGERGWVEIAKELGTNRTAAQCFQVYQRKLNKSMTRSKWTPEEDQILKEAVMTYGEGDWQSVASCLDGRTGQQVLHRWCKSINPAIRSGRWDRNEDAALLAAVRLYGVGQWNKIAQHVPGRTDVKCRERYMNVLAPEINNSRWTKEEDQRLVEIVSRVGIGKWSYVADLLGGRTDNQCWRHWRSLHKQGIAPTPPENSDNEEVGTFPSFPELEREKQGETGDENVQSAGLGDDHDEVMSTTKTANVNRKRRQLTGTERARKRQWKRATSKHVTPLLTTPANRLPQDSLLSPVAQQQQQQAPATAPLDTYTQPLLTPGMTPPPVWNLGTQPASAVTPNWPATSSVGRGGRWASVSGPRSSGAARFYGSSDYYGQDMGTPTRGAGHARRKSRHTNWRHFLRISEGDEAEEGAGQGGNGGFELGKHVKPIMPSLSTVSALENLGEAVPEIVDAFNNALVGDNDDPAVPDDNNPAMDALRQRVEAVYIWPLLLGTINPKSVGENGMPVAVAGNDDDGTQ